MNLASKVKSAGARYNFLNAVYKTLAMSYYIKLASTKRINQFENYDYPERLRMQIYILSTT